jgi:hypothetical protein
MSISNLKSFNAQLENLLNYIIKQFPNFSDAKIFKEKFLIIKSIDPKKIILIFLQFVYVHKQKILNRDDQFFLDDKFRDNIIADEKVQKVSEVNYEILLSRAINLKNIWARTSETQRNTIWTSFNKLVELCEKYVIDNIK